MKNIRNKSWLLIVLSFGFTAVLLGIPAYAQESPVEIDVEIDKIFKWATPDRPGCAIAVSQHGKLVVNRAYGSADLGSGASISPSTVFDAGSLQKQFVAAAVLLLVEETRLSLSDDIRKHIPELPDYGHTVTIDHLLTHTSGIRDWTGILPLTTGNEDALTVILRQRGLNFAPGEEWGYSNSGYVLAKEIVARRSGLLFAEFLRQRVFEPLGMKSTAYCTDINGVTGDRALAYDKEGDRWTPAMRLEKNRGGGAVFSTAADLIIWNEALTNNRLGALLSEKLEEPTRLKNGRKLDYCRGLIQGNYRGAKEVWHTGSAEGYKSWLGRYPEHGLSIAILCNSGDGADRTALAHRVFELFVPSAGAPKQESGPPPAIPADALAEVNSKTGLFFSERTGEPMRLAVERDRFRIAAGPGLAPVAKDRFRRWGLPASSQFMSGDAFELSFLSRDQFELKSMEGETTVYRRAKPFAPTLDDLKAFAGRFESNEIGTVFGVEPKGDGLLIRLEHSPDKTLEFKPVDSDTFQLARVLLRFRRGEDGKVVAFDFSNALIRNIKFTRLGDRD